MISWSYYRSNYVKKKEDNDSLIPKFQFGKYFKIGENLNPKESLISTDEQIMNDEILKNKSI